MKNAFSIQIAKPGELDSNHTTLALPATWPELREAFDKLGIKEITDPHGITLAPDRNWHFLREYIQPGCNLAEVNLLAARLANMDLHRRTAFEGLVQREQWKHTNDPEHITLATIINLAHNVDNSVVAFGITTNEALGNFLYENDMLTDEQYETAHFKKAFSFYADEYMAKLGREHQQAEGGVFTSRGYVENLYPIEEIYQPHTAKLPEQPQALTTPSVDKGLSICEPNEQIMSLE